MATTPLQPIVSGATLTTSFTELYEVPKNKKGIGIDAVVLNNYTDETATYTIRIVNDGNSTILNEIITEKKVRSGSNDLAPAMVGQALITGGTIQAKASRDSALNISITATIID